MRPTVALALIAVTALLAASCESDEELSDSSTPTSMSGDATITTAPTAAASTNPGAPQLATYTDPPGTFTFDYPADWTLENFEENQARVSSFRFEDTFGRFPDDGVMIDVLRISTEALGSRPQNATDGTLGGEDAWVIEEGPTGGGDATWKWHHWLGATHGNSSYVFVGYFGSATPDQSQFLDALSTFKFLK